MAPVPERNLRILDGGERIGAFDVIYTPGHASHHVSFLHATGCAFVGDVAGVRLAPTVIMAPTPPPDVNLDLWRQSLDVLEERSPTSLALSHFGAIDEPQAHLAAVRDALTFHETLAQTSTAAEYVSRISALLDQSLAADVADDYRKVVPPEQNFVGLRRWADQTSTGTR